MTRAALTLAAALFASHALAQQPFVQGRIRIVPPVRQEHDRSGNLVFMTYNDGGTQRITIRDGAGKVFDIYFDHRLGSRHPGTIYIGGYPDTRASIRILDVQSFKRKIIREWGD